MRKAFIVLTALAVLSACAYAVTIHVPGDYPTIQAGIDAAVDGDTVLVADGTYTGTGNKNIDFTGKAIVVISENGAENCIIDCEGDGRGFYFHSGEDSNSVLIGLRIINGLPVGNPQVKGGGIRLINSNPIIDYCIVNENSAVYGSGIYCEDSSPIIKDCTISENEHQSGYGAGICCDGESNPMIINCTISNNWCPQGGGIDCMGNSSPTISNCIISGNHATFGGGIFFGGSSNPSMSRCIIVNNNALHGGGIYSASHIFNPIIENCTFSGNNVSFEGGGIYLNTSTPIIKNCIITGSSSMNYGSGIYFQNSYNVSITFSDFYDNQNGNFGGNSITPGLGTVGYFNVNADPCDYFFNIYLNPLFYSTSGDSAFYLTENSPCIDAGDPESPLDLDGTVSDIGTFYFSQYPLLLIPDVLNYDLISVNDSSIQTLCVKNTLYNTIIIHGIETSDSAFTTDFSPMDSLLAAGDSLEFMVTFAPYDTINYIDTLTVYSSIDTIQADLLGEGISALIEAEPETLDFFTLELGMDTTLSLIFQNTGGDTLEFYDITTSDSVFTIDFPAISDPIPPGGTSDTCWVTFTPTEEIFYEDTLFVLCNAFNAVDDTFIVYLRGEGGIVPDTVRNIIIEAIYPDAVLIWDPVTTSIYGSPITVDCYLIFFETDLYSEFEFLAGVADTTYTHELVVQFSQQMFYEVEAYIGEIGFFNRLLSSTERLSREEVYDLLKIKDSGFSKSGIRSTYPYKTTRNRK